MGCHQYAGMERGSHADCRRAVCVCVFETQRNTSNELWIDCVEFVFILVAKSRQRIRTLGSECGEVENTKVICYRQSKYCERPSCNRTNSCSTANVCIFVLFLSPNSWNDARIHIMECRRPTFRHVWATIAHMHRSHDQNVLGYTAMGSETCSSSSSSERKND